VKIQNKSEHRRGERRGSLFILRLIFILEISNRREK
jgi:hypothetical protein